MQTTAYLVAFLLLGLSILTIEFCRRDSVTAHPDQESYLFKGKRALDAIASNLGSSFSATYLLGAAVIFTQLLGWWAGVAVILLCALSYFLYSRLLVTLEQELGEEFCRQQRGNLLIELMARKLRTGEVGSLAALYALVYLGLLAEELAVSRALLNSLVPGQPVVASVLLLLLCLVILVYVYVGGFRAVLTSDLVQGAVLTAFVAMLIISSLKASPFGPQAGSSQTLEPTDVIAYLLIATVFGISWFVAGIDFAARLNFDSPPKPRLRRQLNGVVRVSFVATSLLLLSAVVFGHFTRIDIAVMASPTEYVESLSRYFLRDSPRIVQITFIVSILCMIFTTIDTLIMTILQASHYTRLRLARRDTIPGLLVTAMLLAIAVPSEHLYLFGLLAGSLLILPMLLLLPVLLPRLASIVPRTTGFAWTAFVGTWVFYLVYGGDFAATTEVQFLSPGVPLVLGLVSLVGFQIAHSLRGDRK
jgi:hypothetical protein